MTHTRTNTNNSQPDKKKTHPFKVALIILGLVLALLVLKVVMILTAKPTISVDYVAEFKRMTKPPNYDPNQNAAPLYLEALGEFGETPEFLPERMKLASTDIGANDLAIIADWLHENRVALALAERAAWKPYCWKEHPNGLTPDTAGFEVAPLIDVARAFFWRSLINAQESAPALAARDVATCYRIGKHLEGPRVLVEQMGSIVIKAIALEGAFTILRQAPDDPNLIHLLQKSLAQELRTSNEVFDWRYEKLLTELAIQKSFSDDGKGDGHLIPRGPFTSFTDVLADGTVVDGRQFNPSSLRRYPAQVWRAATGPRKKETLDLAQRSFDSLTMVAARTPWQGRDCSNDIAQISLKLSQNDFINSVLAYDHFLSCVRKGHWAKAHEAGLLTVLAILRYSLDKGRLPDRLEHLVTTKYLEELPMDPYSIKPLVYKRRGDDFVLYSLGDDFDDDGGVPSNRGEGEEGGDMVFWPVERPERKPN
ncbi:MAG: hypothetical protein ACYTEQ_26030 [Planctomycetota bacterium]|jgi:hypothetical protein